MHKPIDPDNPDDSGDRIDGRALMQIARDLPRFAPEDSEDTAAPLAYGDMSNALCDFLKANASRPTIGDMRASLKRLDAALAELEAAWQAADPRTRHHLSRVMGARPFDRLERRPATDAESPADVWGRGAYRVVKFRETGVALARATARTKHIVARWNQARRAPPLGLDQLIERLAEIFERHKGERFTTTRNRDSANVFCNSVVATLTLPQDRPGPGSISNAVARLTAARRSALDQRWPRLRAAQLIHR